MNEHDLRVDLAACYRLVALYGWDDLVFTLQRACEVQLLAQAGGGELVHVDPSYKS